MVNLRIRQLEQSLECYDTDELLAILQKRDRREWTSEAFDAMEEILLSRLGKLPHRSEETGASNSPEVLSWFYTHASWLSRLLQGLLVAGVVYQFFTGAITAAEFLILIMTALVLLFLGSALRPSNR